jgi:ribosomal-protein-alanine N-acetyltransferase
VRFTEWLTRPTPARIEPLESSHAAAAAEIHAGAFARPWSALEFERLLADERVVADGLFLARKPDPVGFAASRVAADEAEVLSIAIARDARGRGCAGPLLSRHLESLARCGAAKVHLEVEDGNAPALALYRRFGFAEVGRRPGYYLRPDGSRATALTMTKRL